MNTRIALAIGTLALLAGAVGPWASVLGVVSIGPTSNAEVTVVVFGGALVLALSALLQRNMRAASIVVGVLALIEAGYALVKIAEAKSAAGQFGALISPGWGLYLTILAGIYLIASTWIRKTSAPAPAVEAA